MSSSRSRTGRILRILFGSVVLIAIGAVAGWVFVYVNFVRDLPDLRSLEDYQPSLTSVVLDRDGQLIGEFYEHRRRTTPLERVPDHVVKAFLAAEDGNFYEHSGIDYRSIIRAAWANLRAGGETRQGASTITQQMVKQLLLSPERTYKRKIREIILAGRIERRFSKDEILFLYLNEIYFGSGAYGLGEAAFSYFGKQVEELSIAEAALLAGLPKAPGRNSPYRNPKRAEARRLYVLDRMRDEGFIDAASHDTAAAVPPVLAPPPSRENLAVAAYFTEEVRKHLVETLGNDVVLKGGLRIETTLDIDLQRAAVAAVRHGLEAHDRRQGYRGALRRVAAGEIAAETERLAEQNSLRGVPAAELPVGRNLTGVVTAVDRKAQTARIAFAPELSGTVHLEDVNWAREAIPETYRKEVKSIEKVFATGDVANFRRTDPPGKELRVTLAQHPMAQGALISIAVDSGDVLALVGGYDFEESEFNRAVQARRQPGSAFKPIIYAAALGNGYTPASIVHDRPVVYDDPESGFSWRPENYGRRFLGPITLGEALARSVNNATIHLLRDVGVGRVIRLARKLGIEAPLENNLSLALGSSPVSLLELTRAYAIFPAQGRRVETRFIERVLDRNGETLLENVILGAARPTPNPVGTAGELEEVDPPLDPGQAMSATQAYLTTDLLRGVVSHPRGTGRRAQELKRPVGGKTGTTNEQGDAWFMGFSPDIATGVWVGMDEKQVLGRGETGGRAALPVWMDFMDSALSKRAKAEFQVPQGIVFARIDRKSGLLASASSEDAYFQSFLAGTAPTDTADTARTSNESRRRLRLDF